MKNPSCFLAVMAIFLSFMALRCLEAAPVSHYEAALAEGHSIAHQLSGALQDYAEIDPIQKDLKAATQIIRTLGAAQECEDFRGSVKELSCEELQTLVNAFLNATAHNHKIFGNPEIYGNFLTMLWPLAVDHELEQSNDMILCWVNFWTEHARTQSFVCSGRNLGALGYRSNRITPNPRDLFSEDATKDNKRFRYFCDVIESMPVDARCTFMSHIFEDSGRYFLERGYFNLATKIMKAERFPVQFSGGTSPIKSLEYYFKRGLQKAWQETGRGEDYFKNWCRFFTADVFEEEVFKADLVTSRKDIRKVMTDAFGVYCSDAGSREFLKQNRETLQYTILFQAFARVLGEEKTRKFFDAQLRTSHP